MCAPSAPAAPDYAGAARTQGAANLQSTIAQNIMNRPQEVTPLGSREWSQTGTYTIPGAEGNPSVDVPLYKSTINLTPQGQSIYDTQLRQSQAMSNLGDQSLQQTQAALSKPADVNTLMDEAYAAQTARLDPQWNQAATSRETQLTNQGLRPGMEAYDNAMRVFNQGKNDAYQQARLGAIQTIPQSVAIRNLPLNELNALRTGSQVQMPTFQNFSTAGLQAPNYQSAAAQQGLYDTNIWQQKVAEAMGLQRGLFDLGVAGMQTFSDRRLKRDIEQIGMHPAGVPLYRFRYVWDDIGTERIGVMADEVLPVKPQAVSERDGYMMVDYSMLG